MPERVDAQTLREIGSDGRAHLDPSTPRSAEHTEHSAANTDGKRDYGVRSGTEHPTERVPDTPPDLAFEADILERHDELMSELGLVGERHVSRLTFLVHVSRLLGQPGRVVIKGDSSTGKSFATECGLKAAAPEQLYVRTSVSPLALFFSDEDFRHRTLVFYEANKLGDDDDALARVLRTLISEGRLAHEVTVVEKRSSTLLEKEGPVAFISTTCKPSLDKEIETRILSLHSDNSDQQTQNVVRAILDAAAGSPTEPDLAAWHQFDRWLTTGPRDVVVPWAPALGDSELAGPPRLRRDISNLLALARAHALLHRASRERDARDRIVSTLDDYEAVRQVLSDALAVATDKTVRKGTKAIVDAVAALRDEGKTTVSMRAASTKAGRSTSTTHTDVHDALERGYLVNRSQRDNQYDLDIGDPLPAGDDLLPSTETVARAFARRSPGVRSVTERLNPAPGAGSGDSVRSVRSNPGGAADDTLGAAWERLEAKRRGEAA